MEVTFEPIAAPPELPQKKQANEPEGHALGYSRGGFGTKIHLITDSTGTYINPILSAGQEHKSQYFEEWLERIRVSSSRGPDKRRPKHICGDKGYAYKTIRDQARKLNINPVIPCKSNEKVQRKIDVETYKNAT